MAICDDEMTLIPLKVGDPSVAVVLHPSSLLDALNMLFEICWNRSVPIPRDEIDPGDVPSVDNA